MVRIFHIFGKNQYILRKAVKIKSFTIFLAWIVIFAHSIIPHNHLSDNFEGCHELIHEVNAGNSSCDIHFHFNKLPEEVGVCHFSNFLFNQLGQDQVLFSTIRKDYFVPVVLTDSVLVNKSELFLFRPYYGSSSLRAPPAA